MWNKSIGDVKKDILSFFQYVSLLRPPITESSAPGADIIDKVEWKQVNTYIKSISLNFPTMSNIMLFDILLFYKVFDILWSDPQHNEGCQPNGLRGAGTYFGPDVTNTFLQKYKLVFLVRSHECKHDGYELVHNGKVCHFNNIN